MARQRPVDPTLWLRKNKKGTRNKDSPKSESENQLWMFCDRHLSAANFTIWELQSADWSYGYGVP
jgi:hypothetical protein